VIERMENIRLSPAPGFMRLNLGAMAPMENNQPPSDSGPISAASTSTIIKGWVAATAALPDCSRNTPM
jgi:hypothetical protein